MTTTDLFGEQKPAAQTTATKRDSLAWWNALRHDGCLIAPSRLQEYYDNLHLESLSGWQADRLRREISRLEEDNDREALNRLLDGVLVGMLGLSSDYWLKGPQITEEWSIRGMTGEVIKPRRVWRDAFGGILPVFIPEEATPGFGKKTPRLGLGRSRRSVARVVEWLRKTGHKVALVTNGFQWRLLHAGADYDAWCEWDITGWFEEGVPGPQLDALRLLLGPQSVGAPKPGETPRLVAAIQATRKGQAELSSALGERVRQAVELLLRESRSALDQARDDEALNVTNRDIYIAAVRVVMRMVVVLFAESRKLSDADHLLPLGNPTYYSSYSLRGLIELLDREGGGRPLERLRDRKAAWPRLIALFRVLYRGSAHERMPITRYGGGLFTPGSAESRDPVLRALSAIESTRNEISDGVIATILKYLTTAQIRIRQGRSSEPVLAPVDFSQLDTEYIGILYEGLLDYELRRVEEAIPILFLGLGDQPALPLTRLEEMDDKALSSLVEKMGKPSKAAASEEGDGDAEEDADEEEDLAESDDDQDDEESTEVDVPADSLTSTAFDNSDEALLYRQRATAWARKAVEVGKLVKKPRGAMTEAKKREYEADIEKMAGRLVARLVLPGEYYLVRFGGTRKGSGTFYTKPQLARPTVRRTLEPLCYGTAGVSPALNIRQGRKLPHWTKDGSTYHVVFRLGDSVPREVADAWLREREDIIRTAQQMNRPLSEDEEKRLQFLFSDKVDAYLDAGKGECWMKRPEVADLVEGALKHFNGERYDLLAWAVMPNHVHVIFRPREGHDLPDILHSWKSFTAHQANKLLGRTGEFWADEYYDRLIRKEGEFERTVGYVEANPKKAGLKDWKHVGIASLSGASASAINGDSSPNNAGGTPAIPWEPAQILDLKTCDPACGSGSFLVAALRYLTKALYESLIAHGWLAEEADGRIIWGPAEPKVPDWFKEMLADVPGINEAPLRGGDARATSEGQSPEEKIRARLRRIVVERCLYGVDLDPLAVELARLALWVETMDPYLPFSFLDHKIKVGNALVGCWFDRFQDYPALAWERGGGDESHSVSVHYPKEAWTKAIKAKKAEVKDELAAVIEQKMMGIADLFGLGASTDELHTQLVATYQALHDAATAKDPERQAAAYRRDVLENPVIQRLRDAFDTWCALWFWPADQLDIAPMPASFHQPGEDTRAAVRDLRDRLHFFHWEIEFPDVFTESGAGFSATLGNPPWENVQPNPKEWFSNVDPLFKTYGRVESLAWQKRLFSTDEEAEHAWLLYNSDSKAFSNWVNHVAAPYGDPEISSTTLSLSRGKKNLLLHESWRTVRKRRRGYCSESRPFCLQIGRVFTHKLFIELADVLTKSRGRIGLVIPASISSDAWSEPLRQRLLQNFDWSIYYVFQNERFVFENIHHAFKIALLIVEKAVGPTCATKCRFRLGPGDSPEVIDLEDDILSDERFLKIDIETFRHFSPSSSVFLEIRNSRDLDVLHKLYLDSVKLLPEDPTEESWEVDYVLEFMMNTDAKYFPKRSLWIEEGFAQDDYSHWVKGHWEDDPGNSPGGQPLPTCSPGAQVHTVDHSLRISTERINSVALPFYQGLMFYHYDFSVLIHTGKGSRQNDWSTCEWPNKVIQPQFLMGIEHTAIRRHDILQTKIVHRRIAGVTNQRTMIAAILPGLPAGDTAARLKNVSRLQDYCLLALLNSYPSDFMTRLRVSQNHVDQHYIANIALPKPSISKYGISLASARLSLSHACFSPAWLEFLNYCSVDQKDELTSFRWRKLWAVTEHERLRLRCILDAVVAHLYGLDAEDFRWILRDCDHPVDQVTNKAFARKLDPKGFWRVDKHREPELRHTVLAQVAFADLQAMIIMHGEEDALVLFLGTGPDDGWMLPETLRLADYNLGHDARAQQPQKVATALGPRFHDWQLTQSAEESWAECRMHAEKIRKIRAIGRPDVNKSDADGVEPKKALKPERKLTPKGQRDIFDTAEQPEIFDVPEEVAVPAAASGRKSVPPPSFYGTPEYEYYRGVMVGVTEKEEGLTEDELKVMAYLSSRHQRVADLLAGRSNYDRVKQAFAHAPERHLNTDRWHTLRRQLFEKEQVLAVRDDRVCCGPNFAASTGTSAELIECLVEALGVMREFEDQYQLILEEAELEMAA